jgi:hypothetical protein
VEVEVMTHQQWIAKYRQLSAIADRIRAYRQKRGWALAATVGIGRCGCSLHNASTAEVGKGWGAGNKIEPDGRKVIKVARAAKRILDSQFDGSRIVTNWDLRVRASK